MAQSQDMRLECHIFWLRAAYFGEHGALKGTCHMDKYQPLFLCTVNIDWQVRHGIKPTLDLAGAPSGSYSL